MPKKKHVEYLRIPNHLKSAKGQDLWSSKAWYTLNDIPEKSTKAQSIIERKQ